MLFENAIRAVNPRVLIAKYEHDDLNQQGRKESLRLYGLQVKEKETNEELMQTVLTKIAEADIPISEADISVLSSTRSRKRWNAAHFGKIFQKKKEK